MEEVLAIRTELLISSENLSYDEMALVEPLAIGAHALRRAALKAGETIVVVGCGPIGIGILKLAQLQGAHTIALDVAESRLEFVKEKIGVDHIVNVSQNAVAEVAKITNGEPVWCDI